MPDIIQPPTPDDNVIVPGPTPDCPPPDNSFGWPTPDNNCAPCGEVPSIPDAPFWGSGNNCQDSGEWVQPANVNNTGWRVINPITGFPITANLNVPEVFGRAMSYEDKLLNIGRWVAAMTNTVNARLQELCEMKTLMEWEWGNQKRDWMNFQAWMRAQWKKMECEWAKYQSDMNAMWIAYQKMLNQQWADYQNILNQQWIDFQTRINNEWNTFKSLVQQWMVEMENHFEEFTTSITNQFNQFTNNINTIINDFRINLEDHERRIQNLEKKRITTTLTGGVTGSDVEDDNAHIDINTTLNILAGRGIAINANQDGGITILNTGVLEQTTPIVESIIFTPNNQGVSDQRYAGMALDVFAYKKEGAQSVNFQGMLTCQTAGSVNPPQRWVQRFTISGATNIQALQRVVDLLKSSIIAPQNPNTLQLPLMTRGIYSTGSVSGYPFGDVKTVCYIDLRSIGSGSCQGVFFSVSSDPLVGVADMAYYAGGILSMDVPTYAVPGNTW